MMKISKMTAVAGVMAVLLSTAASSWAIVEDLRTFDGGSRSDQTRPANLRILNPARAPRPRNPQARAVLANEGQRPSVRTVSDSKAERAQKQAESAKMQALAERKKSAVNKQLDILSAATRDKDAKAAEAAKQKILQLSAQ